MFWEFVFLIIVTTLIIALQVFLSKQKNEMFGLILPLISHLIITTLFFGKNGLLSFVFALILIGIHRIYHNYIKKDNLSDNQRSVITLLYISHIIAIIINGGLIVVLIPILTLLGVYWLYHVQLIRNTQWLVLIPFLSLLVSTILLYGVLAYFGLFIPTVIFLIIYMFCRNHLIKTKELDKMAIKDL